MHARIAREPMRPGGHKLNWRSALRAYAPPICAWTKLWPQHARRAFDAGAGRDGEPERVRGTSLGARPHRATHGSTGFFLPEGAADERAGRRAMLTSPTRTLSLRRRRPLLGQGRSGVYRRRNPANGNDAALKRWLRQIAPGAQLDFPYFDFVAPLCRGDSLAKGGSRLRTRYRSPALIGRPSGASRASGPG